MHEHLSYAASQLPIPKSNSIFRVPGRLPGLRPLHLQCRARITDAPFVSDPVYSWSNSGADQCREALVEHQGVSVHRADTAPRGDRS